MVRIFLWHDHHHGQEYQKSYLLEIITIFLLSVHLSTHPFFLLIETCALKAYNKLI